MFASAAKAIRFFFDPVFAGIVLRALGLTLLLFVLLFASAEYGLSQLPVLGTHWLNAALEWAALPLFILSMFFLGAPVAALFASLYLDRIADKLEARDYPHGIRGKDLTWRTAMAAGLRLTVLVIILNVLLLPLDFTLPGLAEIFGLLANGWLLGREFFELAALRHISREDADILRADHIGMVFGGGVLIALLSMIPLLDLFAPLFGAAFMVHLFQRISRQKRYS
jgi:CysZ protein